MLEIYSWREREWSTIDLTGFDVVATDGEIGSVHDKTNDTPRDLFVVSTGVWFLGETVVLPVGVIKAIDLDEAKVFVELTKEQIENAPKFDDRMLDDERYREDLGRHYSTPARSRSESRR